MKEMFANDLRGKKLLYLGGIPRARYVVNRARELGIYVIVADFDPNSSAKKVADEGVLINAIDVDALEKFGREQKIDGVMTGYVDMLMGVCYELSKRLGIPYFYTDEMLRAATDKEFFKELSNKYSVPVPQTYHVNKDNLKESASRLNYPVFMKPLDGSGSRGASVCNHIEDFEKQYNYALSFSKKGIVTVEDFLQGTEFILDYLLIDGEPYLASFADRYTTESRGAAINHPNLMVFPSKYLKKYNEEVNPKVVNMFKKSGFNNGVIFLQGYSNEKSITFYETGCRLGGTWPYIDEYFHKVNPLDMLFHQAITGKMLPKGVNPNISANFKGNAAVIYFVSLEPEGEIAKIKGIAELNHLPYVVSLMQYYYEGDHFKLNTLTDVLFLAVHLVADDFEQLKERVNNIYSMVDYLDKDGKSLLCPVFDVDKLEGYK